MRVSTGRIVTVGLAASRAMSDFGGAARLIALNQSNWRHDVLSDILERRPER
jgi:hypothetical protein